MDERGVARAFGFYLRFNLLELRYYGSNLLFRSSNFLGSGLLLSNRIAELFFVVELLLQQALTVKQRWINAPADVCTATRRVAPAFLEREPRFDRV